MKQSLLEISQMSVSLPFADKTVDIISDISLTLDRGERLGIVGESGSGKSITALALMGLLPGRMTVRGSLRFDGQDLVTMPEDQLCRMRGRRAAMIFQEPMTALNPVKSIGAQIAEGRRLHLGESRSDAEKNARYLLDRVGLAAPRFDLELYPHQLSGGQRQRVMIAMAIACQPDLLIADEPTTALDVTVQAQILDLLDELIDETGTSLLLITHDLGVISEMTERIAVMYAGRIVETGPTQHIFGHMAHPYTQGLFAASPHALFQTGQISAKRQRLTTIPGGVPDPLQRNIHCNFADRCQYAQNDCKKEIPNLGPVDPSSSVDHCIACFHPHLSKRMA
ncbi:ABC transporter ATP-binding protein [Daeguia caeni]|uniref:ABC transporter ATP-binding protein n=1 Tax=Daeguia caeni TaxID=439612 RepID=A0ABV9H529_9HYPH